jgi:mycothiol synthase
MNLIPLSEGHLDELARWLEDLPGMSGWDAAWLRRKTLADPDYDPALMLVAQSAGEATGFVSGVARQGQGWIKALVVRPDRQRQGVGSALLRAVEARLALLGVAQVTFGWAPLNYFTPGVDVRLTAAAVFLEQHGYCTGRVSRINMDVSLTGCDLDTRQVEERLVAKGITFARARPADEAAAGRLAEAEGQPDWRAEGGEAYRNQPVSQFVAHLAGQVCGFGVHSVSGPGEFGPLLTANGLRGQGIGQVLLKRCLADLQRQGYRRAEIVWAGPISFYARAVQARIGRVFWEWKKPPVAR